MVMCLDTDECLHENQQDERFCARCGIPIAGAFLQHRYRIRALSSKDRTTVVFNAIDRQTGKDVMVRVLRPRIATLEERSDFLQDAELALSFSRTMHEPGSICVTDYGEDGPVAFLVKTVMDGLSTERPRVSGRLGKDMHTPNPSTLTASEARTPLWPATPEPVTPLPSTHPASSKWLISGDHAYEQGHYEEALAAYDKALKREGISVEAYSGKGATL